MVVLALLCLCNFIGRLALPDPEGWFETYVLMTLFGFVVFIIVSVSLTALTLAVFSAIEIFIFK